MYILVHVWKKLKDEYHYSLVRIFILMCARLASKMWAVLITETLYHTHTHSLLFKCKLVTLRHEATSTQGSMHWPIITDAQNIVETLMVQLRSPIFVLIDNTRTWSTLSQDAHYNVSRVALKTLKLDEYTKRSAFGSTEGRFRKCKTENSNPKLKMTITTTLNIRTIWNCEGNEHTSFETPRHDSKFKQIRRNLRSNGKYSCRCGFNQRRQDTKMPEKA